MNATINLLNGTSFLEKFIFHDEKLQISKFLLNIAYSKN